MRTVLHVLGRAGREFLEDDCFSAAAAIGFYTIFSLPPLLVIIFATAGWLNVSTEQIERVARKQVGLPIARAAQEREHSEASLSPAAGRLQALAERSRQSNVADLGVFSKVGGLLMLIISASWVFAELQYSLNRVWEVEPDPQQGGIRQFIVKRLLSLGMIVVVAFLLLVSLVLTAVVDELIELWQGGASDPQLRYLAVSLNIMAGFILAVLLFASVFKILPDANMTWKDVWLGSAVTAALFVIGKTLIAWYLEHFNIGASWGTAAASMVAMLLWVYYSSLIVLFGAEFTQSWASQGNRSIQPAEGAVRTVEEKRHIPSMDDDSATHRNND